MNQLRSAFITTLLSSMSAIVALASSTMAEVYAVGGDSTSDTVRFESTARLEFIEGSNHDITGWVDFDPADTKVVGGVLMVDLRTLKTGIDLRDRHMRENHLNTDKFPHAYFELKGVSGLPPRLSNSQPESCTVSGYFYIHGVRRQLTADATIDYDTESNSAKVATLFTINLDDYNIERPRALFLKLAETIEVSVSFLAHSGGRDLDIVLPDWPLIE